MPSPQISGRMSQGTLKPSHSSWLYTETSLENTSASDPASYIAEKMGDISDSVTDSKPASPPDCGASDTASPETAAIRAMAAPAAAAARPGCATGSPSAPASPNAQHRPQNRPAIHMQRECRTPAAIPARSIAAAPAGTLAPLRRHSAIGPSAIVATGTAKRGPSWTHRGCISTMAPP